MFDPSTINALAEQSPSLTASPSGPKSVLNGTETAPSFQTARCVIIVSGFWGRLTPTRSPRSTPRVGQVVRELVRDSIETGEGERVLGSVRVFREERHATRLVRPPIAGVRRDVELLGDLPLEAVLQFFVAVPLALVEAIRLKSSAVRHRGPYGSGGQSVRAQSGPTPDGPVSTLDTDRCVCVSHNYGATFENHLQ
jgi:hypothetical protein